MVHRVTFSLTCLTSSTSFCIANGQSLGLGKRLSKPNKAAGFSPACSFGQLPTRHGMYCVSCLASCRITCSASSLTSTVLHY